MQNLGPVLFQWARWSVYLLGDLLSHEQKDVVQVNQSVPVVSGCLDGRNVTVSSPIGNDTLVYRKCTSGLGNAHPLQRFSLELRRVISCHNDQIGHHV